MSPRRGRYVAVTFNYWYIVASDRTGYAGVPNKLLYKGVTAQYSKELVPNTPSPVKPSLAR
jgi:hypothetical protein